MAYGRPLMITSGSSSHLAGCFLLDDDSSANLRDGISGVPSNPLLNRPFYIEALKLLKILEETLVAFYRPKDSNVPSECHFEKRSCLRFNLTDTPPINIMLSARDFQVLLSLDSALTSWHENIPPILRWASGTGNTACENVTESTSEPASNILIRQMAVLEARCVILASDINKNMI